MSNKTKEILNCYFTIFHHKYSINIDVKPNQFKTVGQLCDYCFSKLPNIEQQNYKKFRQSTTKQFSTMLKNPNWSIKGWRCKSSEIFFENADQKTYESASISRIDQKILTQDYIWINFAKKIQVETKAHEFKCLGELILYLGKIAKYDFEKNPIMINHQCKYLWKYFEGERVSSFFDNWFLQDKIVESKQKNIYTIQSQDLVVYYERDQGDRITIYINAGTFKSIKDFMNSISSYMSKEEQKLYKKTPHNFEIQFSMLLNNIHEERSYKGWWIKTQERFDLFNRETVISSLTKIKTNSEIPKTYFITAGQTKIQIMLKNFLTRWIKKYMNANYQQLWMKFEKLTPIYITEKEKTKAINDFGKVIIQEQMFHLLGNSPSLYHPLCDFFSKTPIENNLNHLNHEHKFELHHIIPMYITNIHELPNRNKHYNLVKLPYLIH